MRWTNRGGVAAVSAALLVGTGCSSDSADEQEETRPPVEERISFEEVALPESLASTSRRVGPWSVVPQSGELPRLAATPVAHGRASQADVGVWQATGTDLLSEQGEVEVAGDVATAHVASDGELTAIAGYATVDGGPRSFLLTSADRVTWEPVELGPDAAAVAASHVAVSDGRVYLLGRGATGRTPRVAMHDSADGSTTGTALPEPGPDEELRLAGVAAIGQRVVVIAQVAPMARHFAPRIHVSDDGGGEFTAIEMGPDTFEIRGVIAADDEFVATGAVRTNGYTKPASWSSGDGRSWSVDDIMSLWEWDPRRWASERADVRFSAPSYDPGTDTVAAAIINDTDQGVLGATRDGRTWSTIVATGALGFGPTGVAMQLGDRTSVLTTFSDGSAEESQLDAHTDDFRQVELVSYEVEPNRVDIADLGDQAGIGFAARSFVSEADTTRLTFTSRLFSYSADDGFVAADWGPDGLAEESRPVVATNPTTGQTVLMTHHWSGDGFHTRAWLRDQAGSWGEPATIDAAGIQAPTALTYTEDGWLAALDTAPWDGSGTGPRQAEIWSSTDALEWARQDGEFSLSEGGDSRVSDICNSAVGVVAVGEVQEPDGTPRATAWRQSDGAWEPVEIPDAAGATLTACVDTAEGVIAFGSDGTTSRSWSSADLSTFTSAATVDEGLHRDDVVVVPGGYAAGGTARTEDYVGPVLWLSPDAEGWTWVPLPVSTSSLTSPVVDAVGGDLLVVHPLVHRAWRVPDIASVLTD